MLVSSISALSELNPYPLTYGRKSERVASLSSTAAGLLRDSFKSSSGALNFKESLRRQGIGFRRCFFQSFASAHSMSAVLRKTTEPVGSVHFRNVYLGRGSFIHASQALRPEKRGSPLPMGRTGTDSITLPLHCVRTRPAGKEVRLRLVLFNAHFILSGSVVHFVSDTSSGGERRLETVTAGVPLLCTPSLTDSQSGIAMLSLRSICAGPRRSRGFSPSVAATGFTPTAPSPSVSSPFTAPIPTPPLRRPSPFRRPGSHVRSALPFHQNSTIRARAGKTIISRLDHLPSDTCRACRLACSLSGRQKERCFRIALPDFLRVERWDEPHAPSSVHNRTASHVRSEYKDIFISNRKHSRASTTRFIRIVFRFDILVTAINTLYATYVVKTCNALSPYA